MRKIDKKVFEEAIGCFRATVEENSDYLSVIIKLEPMGNFACEVNSACSIIACILHKVEKLTGMQIGMAYDSSFDASCNQLWFNFNKDYIEELNKNVKKSKHFVTLYFRSKMTLEVMAENDAEALKEAREIADTMSIEDFWDLAAPEDAGHHIEH